MTFWLFTAGALCSTASMKGWHCILLCIKKGGYHSRPESKQGSKPSTKRELFYLTVFLNNQLIFLNPSGMLNNLRDTGAIKRRRRSVRSQSTLGSKIKGLCVGFEALKHWTFEKPNTWTGWDGGKRAEDRISFHWPPIDKVMWDVLVWWPSQAALIFPAEVSPLR